MLVNWITHVNLKKIHWLLDLAREPTIQHQPKNIPLKTYLGHNQVLSDVASGSNPTQNAWYLTPCKTKKKLVMMLFSPSKTIRNFTICSQKYLGKSTYWNFTSQLKPHWEGKKSLNVIQCICKTLVIKLFRSNIPYITWVTSNWCIKIGISLNSC